jgi:molecular chaperone GrpE (heat shock protein)
MTNDTRKEATATEAVLNREAELTQLKDKLGVHDDGLYLSKERIQEIADDAKEDAEKRQLASRLLEVQDALKRVSAIHLISFKHAPFGDNIFKTLDPLNESRLVRFRDLQGNSGSPESGE